MENINKIRLYYIEWLKRHKKAQEVVPVVKHNLQFTEWEIDVLKNKPADANIIASPDLSTKIEQENKYIEKALPMIPDYDLVIAWDSTAVTTSSSSDIYAFVSSVGDIGSPETVEYADKYTAKYRKLQSDHNRLDKVRTLISNLSNPETTERFEQAFLAYNRASTNIGERTAAANEIRNLLYGVKGDLFDKARKWTKENMMWLEMSNRLAKGGLNSTEHQDVLDQENKHSHLIDQLSNVSKGREGNSMINLDDVWSQVLDHLFIVLTLVNI